MNKTALVIGAASICLAGTTAPAALAQGRAPGANLHQNLKVTANPHKNLTPGEAFLVTAKHALKNKTYYCIMTLTHKGVTGSKTTADDGSIQTIQSTKSGKVTCHQLFEPFTGKWKGKKHACPPSKADAKAGWGCGVALVDAKTQGKKSFGIAHFSAK